MIPIHSNWQAALIYLTKQLSYELAPDIRVNGVAPAIVKTKLSQLLWENEEFAKNLHLLKKLGEPEDIANAVYYMCSDDAGWVTGEVLTIDGGFLLSGNSLFLSIQIYFYIYIKIIRVFMLSCCYLY